MTVNLGCSYTGGVTSPHRVIEGAAVGFGATATTLQAGPCRVYVGKRSDPFFADADGVLHWLIDGAVGAFQWTGTEKPNFDPRRATRR